MWSVNEAGDYWSLLTINFNPDQWLSTSYETNEFCIGQNVSQTKESSKLTQRLQ
jgi:hypothetical protein